MVKLVGEYGQPVCSGCLVRLIGFYRMMDACYSTRTNRVPFIAELSGFAKNLQFLNIGTTIASYLVWVLDFF
jgi:hypothetical protein